MSNGDGGMNIEQNIIKDENVKQTLTGKKVISSFCNWDQPQCVQVEIDHVDGHVLVSDSKHPLDDMQNYTREEWDAFIKGVKAGEFDYDTLVTESRVHPKVATV